MDDRAAADRGVLAAPKGPGGTHPPLGRGARARYRGPARPGAGRRRDRRGHRHHGPAPFGPRVGLHATDPGSRRILGPGDPVATASGSRRILGPGDPVATASGTAADLLLLLWGRLDADDPALSWDGDSELARSVLAGGP